ncbi:MAG: sigma-54 dependent transcriptional regulator, partial [Desulfobacteraceae bacterium]
RPDATVVMVTALRDLETAVQAIKAGAHDYVVKPFVVKNVLEIIHKALESRTLPDILKDNNDGKSAGYRFEGMVAASKAMEKVFKLLSAVARSGGSVLIQGESGTGKELVARAIHNRSPRREAPFIVVNCAAVPTALMESELFGRNKGAFTGATTSLPGKIELAEGGTVFLDDIDSLDLNLQAKLLRVIQEKEIERLGSNKVKKVNVRFLASCNKDLEQLIRLEKFREDLFFRLNVFPLHLPPLRERRSDIPLLLDHFLKLYRSKEGADPLRFSPDALEALVEYDWPGNIRELENLVQRLCAVVRKPEVTAKDLPRNIAYPRENKPQAPLKDAVRGFERQYIGRVLESVNGNRKEAAKRLGIHRNTLTGKMTQLGLDALEKS